MNESYLQILGARLARAAAGVRTLGSFRTISNSRGLGYFSFAFNPNWIITLDLTLALGLLLGVVLACGATTANISSLKVSTDEQGKNEAKSFKPGDKVYAVAQIANNSGTVQAKFRILYDDVEGQTAGTLVQGAEKTLDVEGDRPAIFWITLPPSGFQNGRYKVETSMLYSGDQKDQKSATFDVIGY